MQIGKERENSLKMIKFRIIDFVNQKKRFIFVLVFSMSKLPQKHIEN